MNINLTSIKIILIDVHAKFALEWQTFIGVNTLTWAPNTTKNMTTSTNIQVKLDPQGVDSSYHIWTNMGLRRGIFEALVHIV